MNKAVVLLSGGIDSATCMAIACNEYDEILPVHASDNDWRGAFISSARLLAEELE